MLVEEWQVVYVYDSHEDAQAVYTGVSKPFDRAVEMRLQKVTREVY